MSVDVWYMIAENPSLQLKEGHYIVSSLGIIYLWILPHDNAIIASVVILSAS